MSSPFTYCQKCGAPSKAAEKPIFCFRCGNRMSAAPVPNAPRAAIYDNDNIDDNDNEYGEIESDINYNLAKRVSRLDFDFEKIDNNNPVKIEKVMGSSSQHPYDAQERNSTQEYTMEDFMREAGSLRNK